MQPHHTRIPEDERREAEIERRAEEQGDAGVEARDEQRDDDEAERRHSDHVRHDHRAGEISGLALEHQSAGAAALMHREERAPHRAAAAARTAEPQDGGEPAHQKYCRTTAATMMATAAPTMSTSGTR